MITAATMEEGLDAAAVAPVDAAIVDLLLPDGDGIELCRRLREWTSMPIILLSAVGEEEEKVRALRAGADDYVTKPFGARELVARLEAVLRRTGSGAGGQRDRAGRARGRPRRPRRAPRRRAGPPHADRVRAAAAMFVRNRGRLLTHRALLIEVWGPEYADDVTVLRGQIANLRRKIEPADRSAAPLHPHRAGHRLPLRSQVARAGWRARRLYAICTPRPGFCTRPAHRRPTMVSMDFVAIALGIISFAVLYALILGIERI